MLKAAQGLVIVLLVLVGVVPAFAQDQDPVTLPLTCADGLEFENAAEISIVLRPGQAYTVTVIGLDDFNPQIAVYDYYQNTEFGCNADEPKAAAYAANLPTIEADASDNTAQLKFTPRGNNFVEVSLFVSDEDQQGGEFVLLFETLSITRLDGPGDPVRVPVTRNVENSDVPFTVYMIGLQDNVDPLILAGTYSYKAVTTVVDGQLVQCDDSGTLSCFGRPPVLRDYTITTTKEIATDVFDALLTLDWDQVAEVQAAGNDLMLIMATFQQFDQKFMGNYMLAFHMGISE